MATRTARTAWNGTLQEGSGRTELASSGLGTYDVLLADRVLFTAAAIDRLIRMPKEPAPETTPETTDKTAEEKPKKAPTKKKTPSTSKAVAE